MRLGLIGVMMVFGAYLIGAGARLVDPAVGPLETSDAWWRIGHAAAGWLVLASGVAALTVPSLARAGAIASLAALAWFAPDLARFEVAPLPIRAAGVAAGLLVVPLLLHLTAELLSADATTTRSGRRVLVIVDVVAGIGSILVFMTYAPFYDLRCAESCAFPDALVPVAPASGSLVRDLAGATTVLSGVVLAAEGIRSWRAGSSSLSWRRLVLGGAVLAGLAGVGIGIVSIDPDLASLGIGPIDAAWIVLPAMALGAAGIACGLGMRALDLAAAPRRVRRLADSLALEPVAASLEASLSEAIGDPDLRVAFLTDQGRSLAADGSDLVLAQMPGRRISSLVRGDTVISLVRHRDDIDEQVLRRAFRPSLLLALDNERLRALRLSTLHELRSSRARIVELGDAERRRIERDLHDGAQQRLLAIAFDLRLAHATAIRDGRRQAAAAFEESVARALMLIDELRRLCHGIHPQVLTQAGLPAALAALADDSEIPLEVRVTAVQAERPPLSVETAAYELVVDALAQGVSRGAPAVTVDVETDGGAVIIEAVDGASGTPEVRTSLADRIGAVGGVLTSGSTERGGYLRAVLPCA
jgi:signal transduction histidine kinase